MRADTIVARMRIDHVVRIESEDIELAEYYYENCHYSRDDVIH